jgi:protein TonB
MKVLFTLVLVVFASQLMAQNELNDSSKTFNFAVVESFPVYQGCDENAPKDSIFACMNTSIMSFIAANFSYPTEARKNKIEGRVFVNFIIEKDGSISNVEIARSAHKLLDDEAERVIKKLPRFAKPAYDDGKPVRMQYTVPINAKLQ